MEGATMAPVVNGWSMNTDTDGVYGNYYFKASDSGPARPRLKPSKGCDIPDEFGRREWQTADGANNYTLHFDKDNTPPVDAFWSVTLYDSEGFRSRTASIGLL
jgi:hypothetical protein